MTTEDELSDNAKLAVALARLSAVARRQGALEPLDLQAIEWAESLALRPIRLGRDYILRGPEGIPVRPHPLSAGEVAKFAAYFMLRLQRQGFYAGAGGHRIDLEDVPEALSVDGGDSPISASRAYLEYVRARMAESGADELLAVPRQGAELPLPADLGSRRVMSPEAFLRSDELDRAVILAEDGDAAPEPREAAAVQVCRKLAEIIEATYAHDADGNRIGDSPNPTPGLYTDEAIAGLEGEVFAALGIEPPPTV